MRLGKHLLLAVPLVLALAAPLAGPAAGPAAALPGEPAARTDGEPGLSVTAKRRYAGDEAPVTVHLHDDAGQPLAGQPVLLERRTDGTWREVASLTTDEEGRARTAVELSREPRDNRVRATYAGDGTTPPDSTGVVGLELRRRNARVVVGGPGRVVDERSVAVKVRWTTGQGEGVSGPVVLERRVDGRWRRQARLETGPGGRAQVVVTPREDSRWRARSPRRPWLERGTSPVHRIDNLPPGQPVALPAGAPRPRRALPPQPRAVGEGPNARVTAIPQGVWNQMTGRSWHRGCPVGRAGLRLLRINYWGFDGYRYRGEVVAAASVVGQMAGALADMYRAELPVRRMYRVDRFGWSARLRGADDYASMAADNTSAFNCRQVVGRPGVRSPHAYGRSLDVNPWENPYRASHGWTPNGWWVGRTHPRVAWRSSAHQVVRIMARHGLRWTYGTADAHHFDAYPSGGSRPADEPAPSLPPVCDEEVCH